MEQEIWKDVKGYEGLYQVSNLGRVKSLRRKTWNGKGYFVINEKYLKESFNNSGYKNVGISKNGKSRFYAVHRLVAETFVKNPNNYNVVNHINEIKTDNRPENLEWCTKQYNSTYGTARERQAKKTRKKVVQYDVNGVFIRNWDYIRLVEKELGIRNSDITACCKGRRKLAGGYKWEYLKKGE